MNDSIASVGAARRAARMLCGILVATTLGLAMAGCGGGGGNSVPSGGGTSSGSGSGNPPPPAPSTGARATLVVKVVDAFGTPVPIANVEHRSASGSVWGSTGPAGLTPALDVPAGAGTVFVSNIALGLQRADVDLGRGTSSELRLALQPFEFAAFGVLQAEVVPGSVTADGSSLELRVEVAVPAEFYRYQRPSGSALATLSRVDVARCDAREGDVLATLGPVCVDAGDGTDRDWQPVGEIDVGPKQVGSGVPAGPVLVLLDRSERAGQVDTYEEHLFAAKSLVAGLLDDRPVALGAFADDGGPAGTASPLPEKPVTFYPVENPGWIADRVVALRALDSLRGTKGGTSALASAIDSGVDFILARSDASEHPALVVLTAGGAEGCHFDSSNSPDDTAECLAIRAAAERARQMGVTLWLMGPGDGWYGRGSLAAAAREARVPWVAAPSEGTVHAASEVLRAALLGRSAFHEVRFRISAEVAGTFVPGVVIRGGLAPRDFAGEWDSSQWLPFRATVPAPAG